MRCAHVKKRGSAVWAALAASLLLAGYASGPPSPLPPSPEPETYRVGAPDLLLIQALPDPVISRAVTVRPDGYITFELIGDVEAAGRTPAQIADDIARRLSRFKRDASVTVSVEAARSDVVSIYGEVSRVGTMPLITQTRVGEAIAAMGGTTFTAWDTRVRVIRPGEESTEVLAVNLSDIKDGDLTTNIVLQGGDIVVVPPTPIARVGYFLQTILFPYQQVLGPGLGVANLAANLGAF